MSGYQYPGKEWETCRPESEGIDSGVLESALADLGEACGANGIRTTVVTRRGRLIWAGPEGRLPVNVRSGTKVITSTVFGLLIEDGLCHLDTRAISDGSATPWVPNPPVFSPPGSQFHYHDDAMRMFGQVLQTLSGITLDGIFRGRIAERIGIRQYFWPEYLANEAGNDPASSFVVSAEDLTRVGLLYLSGGSWNGVQLINPGYAAEATRSQTGGVSRYTGPVYRGVYTTENYGFGWWIQESGEGDFSIPNLPPGSFFASGFSHNRMYVIPEWDMVITRTGDNGIPHDHRQVWGDFFRALSRAVYE
jgi:CubicO group peptidase (beta-lactamase class C family)